MKEEYYMIGSREDVLGGAIFRGGDTDQGVVFKDERAFKEKNGICYIGEYGFAENSGFEVKVTIDNFKELETVGRVYTYYTILEEVEEVVFAHLRNKAKFEEYKDFAKYLTECVFDILDWQSPLTYIHADLDVIEQYKYYQEKKEEDKMQQNDIKKY